MIDSKNTNPIYQVALPLAVILLLAWYITICCNYPYYFVWDMDYVTSLDTVLIQSKMLPDHICHPGFGTYLPLFFTEKIAHFFNVISVIDLKDIAGSLNPLAGMAELTNFIRLHSPFLCLSIAVFLASAVYCISELSCWFLLFCLVFLGLQESLTYHSAMVRTELYSIFYWSAAVLTIVTAAKTTRVIGKVLLLLLTGLLLGLSLLTKLQSLFYVAGLAILTALVFSLLRDYQKQTHNAITGKGACWLLAVSLFNVISFLFLAVISYSTPIPPGIPTWASAFRITLMTVVFFLALFLLFICQLVLYLANKLDSDAFNFSSVLVIIAVGFILSFALHFLLYSDVTVSMHYMLYNFKMMFLREPKLLKIPTPSSYISNFLLYLRYNPMLFVVNITFNLLLVLGYRLEFVRIKKSQLLLCLLLTTLALVNIVVATRFILRDILWKEVLLNFLSLFYFVILLKRATRYRLRLTGLGLFLLISLFFVNCIHTYKMPTRINANYNHYGWWQDKWFDRIYDGNQRKYRAIMLKKYNAATAWVAKAKAVDHKQTRKTVDFVFNNQALTLRNIGIAFEGSSVWTTDLAYRITEVPPALKGATLVDNATVRLRKNSFFKKEYVGQHSEYLDKFKETSSVGLIPVLTRRDLRIFLFVQPDDIPQLVNDQIVQTPYKIVVQNSTKSIELQGLEIKNYCEIPMDKINKKFFFVIREI